MFELVWRPQAREQYDDLQRRATGGRPLALFKQVAKALKLLRDNPRHPSLQTHPFSGLENPYDKDQKVFEAYVQQHTPGAYRVFWCYGPKQGQISLIAITPHP